MRHLRARLALTTAAVVAAGLALSACGASSNPTVAASTPAGSASGAATSVVIGSADFSKAKRGPAVAAPKGKARITIRLDEEVLEWFKAQVDAAGGGNYQTLINAASGSIPNRNARATE